jgi:hypothetical protein
MHRKLISSLTALLHYCVSKHKDRYDHLNGSSFHTANRNLTYLWNSQSERNWSPLMWKITALLVFYLSSWLPHSVETWVLVSWQIDSVRELRQRKKWTTLWNRVLHEKRATSQLAKKCILILWNVKVQVRFRSSLQLVLLLGRMSLVHTIPRYFFTTWRNMLLHFTLVL